MDCCVYLARLLAFPVFDFKKIRGKAFGHFDQRCMGIVIGLNKIPDDFAVAVNFEDPTRPRFDDQSVVVG
jgi:hypothetical protein